jgi:hypothetical protein
MAKNSTKQVRSVKSEAEKKNRELTELGLRALLINQQSYYCVRTRTSDDPVSKKAMAKYAKLCFKAFKHNLRLCVTDRDHLRLHRHLLKRTRIGGQDFLSANLVAKAK